MAEQDGVTVEIISNGQRLPVYLDPDGDESEIPTYYIEAVTGATFKIRARFSKRFQFGGCSNVEVLAEFDGASQICLVPSASYLRRNGRAGVTIACQMGFDNESNQWKEKLFSFGALDRTETIRPGEKPDQFTKLGQIDVMITRSTMVLLAVPRPAWDKDGEEERVKEVSEKTLKGRAVENSVELITGATVPEQPLVTDDPHSIDGPMGEPIEFRFLYRSRRTLQYMGLISRTPSPEPEQSARELEKELKEMRARLAFLEKGKAEPGPSNTTNSIKHELEITGERSARKRSRHSGPIAVVDLTDD